MSDMVDFPVLSCQMSGLEQGRRLYSFIMEIRFEKFFFSDSEIYKYANSLITNNNTNDTPKHTTH